MACAYRHQAIALANVDSLSIEFKNCGVHLRAILQVMPNNSIRNMK